MMREWLLKRDDFQHAILALEGCRDRVCGSCGNLETGEYRCMDCYSPELLCQNCCLKDHARHPFHSIRQWKGKYFQSSSLKELGFVLYMGHGGLPCPENEGVDVAEFVVVDVDRIHVHQVAWCKCANNVERWKQLLQGKLYPASIDLPRTAFTF
jgi:CxC2 like cysteine cluster associated with KDZ transposases